MAITYTYAFDLYPRADPKDGARLVRMVYTGTEGALQSAEYRGEANGTGSGRIGIRADTTIAGFIDPLGLQYVRVVEIDTDTVDGATTSGFAERVVGGFFLENGDFAALNTNQTRLLTFGGAGTLSYLGREVLWSRAYLYAADNIVDGTTWHFYNQASLAGGDFLGAVLHRVISEAQSFASPVVEADDKPETALVETATTFGQFNDSAAQLWTVPSGEFKAQVGENILSIVKRLMEAGIYIEIDPDTFEINAWEYNTASSRGQDKSGAAWGLIGGGPNWVIRFQKPSAGTVETGNVLSDMKRGLGAFVGRTVILAGDNGTYVAETQAGTVPYHGYYPNDSQDADTLTFMAGAQLAARSDATDVLRVRFKLGDDPANGVYRPFLDEQIQFNDIVTVHTGTGQWDFNEDEFRVAAITIALRPGGDWDGYVDLGSAYSSMAERAFQVAGVKHHTHPPNPRLCDVASGGGVASCALAPAEMTAIATPNGDFEAGTGANWGGAVVTAGDPGGVGGSWYSHSIGVGAAGWTYDGWLGQTFTAGQAYVVRVYANDHLIRFGDIAAGDYAQAEVVTAGVQCLAWTPSANRTAVYFDHARPSNGELSTDNLQLYTGGGGANPLHGTSNQAARCDHVHHVLSDRDPTVTDDTDAGYPATTLWTNTTSGSSFLSTDDTAGAAVWDAFGGAASDHGALTGLADDDHPQYVRWFNVKSTYGATGDGTTDDTAAINSAIAALVAAGSGVLYFPKGTYKTTAGLSTLSVPCVVRGDGSNDFDGDSPISLITCTSATANVFTVTADHAKFVDIAGKNTAGTTPTAGSFISTQGAHIEQRVDYDSITVHGFYINVDVQVGGQWTMQSCFIGTPVQYGVKIRNTVNPDAGDWSISDCNFNAGAHAAAAGIRVESSGGGKITNTKINMGYPPNQKFAYGIDYAIGTGSDTVILMVSNVSIENITADAIRVQTTGTGRFGMVVIDGVQVGNYANNTGYAVNLIAASTGGHSAAGGIGTVIIDGLVADTGGTPRAAVSLTNTDNVVLGEMALSGFNARYIGSGDTNTSDSSAGVTDHGALTGLADDDHTQYLTEARHDALAHSGLGHYEVIVSGSAPPVAVTNEAEDDWLVGWIPG